MTGSVRLDPVPPPPPPPPVRERGRHRASVGTVLVVVGLLCWAGHLLLSGGGDHAWDRHPTPPAQVQLTAGTSYLISTVDGPGARSAPEALVCTYRRAGTSTTLPLSVTAVTVDSRATHAVASVVSPVSGAVTVSCSGGVVGSRPVFVDDADDASTDVAGALLVPAVLALVVGGALLLGALAGRGPGGRVRDRLPS